MKKVLIGLVLLMLNFSSIIAAEAKSDKYNILFN